MVYQLANQVVPSPWQQLSAGGPMLMADDKWQTRGELASAMFEWIECSYNPYRRHSSFEMLSPIAYEELYRTTNATA
jgi:transposase InsO family protein